MTCTQITFGAATISYAGIESVTFDANGGNDTFTGSFVDFAGALTLGNFEAAFFSATTLHGDLDVQAPGVLDLLSVSGVISNSSTILASNVAVANVGILAGSMTVGSLHNATIDTVTSDGALIITSANTGEDITIGTIDGTFDAAHLTNITITNLGGTMTAGNLETLAVEALSGSATIGELHDAAIADVMNGGLLDITGANTGKNIGIGVIHVGGVVRGLHFDNVAIATLAGEMQVDGLLEKLTVGSVQSSAKMAAGEFKDVDLSGSAATDQFVLANNSLTINGAVIQGTFTSLTLKGLGGDDTFNFAADGVDVGLTLDGGAGVNTLDYSAFTAGIAVTLADGTGLCSATGITGIRNVQNVTGGAGSDTILGNAGDNVLIGNAGSDILHGNGGNDVITGGLGNDTIDGGAGSDRLASMKAPMSTSL